MTKGLLVRLEANHELQAGARDRACIISTFSASTKSTRRLIFLHIINGFLEFTGNFTCSAPRRISSCVIGPPAVATIARPPPSTIAPAMSTAPLSTPPVTNAGKTCKTVGGRVLTGEVDCNSVCFSSMS